jgi:hypothetical protein
LAVQARESSCWYNAPSRWAAISRV